MPCSPTPSFSSALTWFRLQNHIKTEWRQFDCQHQCSSFLFLLPLQATHPMLILLSITQNSLIVLTLSNDWIYLLLAWSFRSLQSLYHRLQRTLHTSEVLCALHTFSRAPSHRFTVNSILKELWLGILYVPCIPAFRTHYWSSHCDLKKCDLNGRDGVQYSTKLLAAKIGYGEEKAV